MMESKEVQILHHINQQMSIIFSDLTDLATMMRELTKIVYDREMEKCNNKEEEEEIKLHSHM